MYILTPDKSILAYRYYHIFGKSLIPMSLFSAVNNKYCLNYNVIDMFTTINLGYHSYFSTSSIISDYIKHPRISNIARITNLNLHLISTFGIFKYINTKTMDNLNR